VRAVDGPGLERSDKYSQIGIAICRHRKPWKPRSLGRGAVTSTPPQTTSFGGDTPVTIQSQGMRGYQVFLDGNYIGTEGTGGDPLDGKFSFSVVGNQNHDIRAYDGQSTTRRRCTSKEEFRR